MSAKPKCGPVTVRSLETGEILRVEPALTEKEVKDIVNKGLPHKNSIAERIKHDPELLKKYEENSTKYYQDLESLDAQYNRNINASSLTSET